MHELTPYTRQSWRDALDGRETPDDEMGFSGRIQGREGIQEFLDHVQDTFGTHEGSIIRFNDGATYINEGTWKRVS